MKALHQEKMEVCNKLGGGLVGMSNRSDGDRVNYFDTLRQIEQKRNRFHELNPCFG